MSARIARPLGIVTPESAPLYEARVRRHGPADFAVEVWQLPSAASPQVRVPVRIAGLRGRNLDIVEHRVLRRLSQSGLKLTGLEAGRKEGHRITEDLALTLGLLFRALAPMRSRDKMRAVAEGIDAMGREEAGYWLGMAMHRKNPRRVLTALRFLFTDPKAPDPG